MNIEIIKALRFLKSGKYEKAEKILQNLLQNAKIDTATFIVTNCILWEYYFLKNDFQNAKKYLQTLLEREDDGVMEREKRLQKICFKKFLENNLL